MCIQSLLKIKYVNYYLPITDLGKLSNWSLIKVTVLVLGLDIFVDVVLVCFQVEKNVFVGIVLSLLVHLIAC